VTEPPTTTASTRRPPSSEPLVVERVPWSELGPEFIAQWGRYEPRNPQPEHMELLGPNGSGKTFLLAQINAEMIRRRQASIIFVATKKADDTIMSMGYPIAETWRETQKHDQVLFWPQTSATGRARKAYQAGRIQELLDNLWGKDANTIIEFDEFAYAEALDPDLKATLQMYLREGRSHGITVVAGKQRPQGTQRDMHSETRVTMGFRMKDLQDNERLAELLASKRELLPTITTLDRSKHEFVFRHDLSDSLFVSWVDKPVNVRLASESQRGYRR
jgi:hypothetical protein